MGGVIIRPGDRYAPRTDMMEADGASLAPPTSARRLRCGSVTADPGHLRDIHMGDVEYLAAGRGISSVSGGVRQFSSSFVASEADWLRRARKPTALNARGRSTPLTVASQLDVSTRSRPSALSRHDHSLLRWNTPARARLPASVVPPARSAVLPIELTIACLYLTGVRRSVPAYRIAGATHKSRKYK